MLNKTQLLKAKLEESRDTGYATTISPLRPGQESIMVIRQWQQQKTCGKSYLPQSAGGGRSASSSA
jgi:hypothetical protein